MNEGVRAWRAPGRVNLIGEHTDYNLGFVLPVALDLACRVTTTPVDDRRLHVFSEVEQEEREWPVEQVRELRPQHHWTDYVIGVAQELIREGYPIDPIFLRIASTVPEGSGLSSSAALEVSSALALLDGRPIGKLDLAKLCQRAEVGFVGLPVGIMDQYASVFGVEHAALKIDCLTLEHETVKLPDGVVFLAVNSMVKHALASSAYRQRTEECAAAVRALQSRFAEVKSLRDATLEQLEQAVMPPVVAKRARHVVTEDARVSRFVAACRKGDLPEMGRLFVESHRSLQQDYEVSCAELDFLVDTALGIEGLYGARMTGGGFGGCTVNMMRPDAARRFSESILRAYQERFGVEAQIYDCRPSAGAGEITL
jgi:galactokinase